MAFTLAPLPYPASALEPHIDAQTMEIHHGRHHKAYVDNANKALDGTKWADMSPVEVMRQLADLPENIRTAVRNNAGGHVNHTMFWESMAPVGNGGGGEPSGSLMEAIKRSFGEFSHFKDEFAKAAMSRFGSGWAWLCVKDGNVTICSTANQDNPLMGQAIAGCGGIPILGLDVWEHAYYLKYQNKRADYVGAWWNVVNWPEVAKRFAAAK
ncbi:MAG: superoxide dismutase [Phycisphaeraceae bacterium]|nr:superoxide dismutase [Phycisphaeraceae bacterium]